MSMLLNKEDFLKKLSTDREFNSKYGRKHITENKAVLPPCHYGFQVWTRELSLEERLNLAAKTYKVFDILDFNLPAKVDHDEIDKLYPVPKRAISLSWNQRSCDTPLGIPFNVASYGLLLCIIAEIVNMVPEELIGNLGDTHIYSNQIDGVKEQLTRKALPLPSLYMNTEFWCPDENSEEGCTGLPGSYTSSMDQLFRGLEISDFQIENYKSQPSIKFPLSN